MLTSGTGAFEQLFERTSIPSLLFKGETFVACNEAAVRLLGYASSAEITSKHPSEISPSAQPDGRDSAEKSMDMVAIALQDGEHKFDWAHLKKDGSTIMVEVTLTPLEIHDEAYLHIVWRDLTGQVSQFESQSLLQLIEHMGDPHFIYNNSVYTDCNQAAVDILGYPDKTSLLHVGREAFYPPLQPDGRDSFTTSIKMSELAREKGTISFDWTYLKYDGTPIQTAVMMTHSIIEGEEVMHVVLRDLTERLETQSDSIKQLLNKLGEATLLIKGHQYIDCNQAAADLLGYPDIASLLNIHPIKISPVTQPDGRDSVEKANEIMDAAVTEGSMYFEWTHLKYDGTPIVVEVMVTPVSINNEALVHVIWRDLTERIEEQEALKRSEKKLQTMYDSHMEAWMLMDESGFLDCNQVCVELYGADSKEHFCTLHPKDLSPEKQPNGDDSFERANELIRQAFIEGSSRFEWQHKRFDTNKTFFTEVLLSRVDIEGKTLIQANIRNIDDRKIAEEALQTSEKNLRMLFESSPDALFIQDGNSFINCNQAAVDLFECESIDKLRMLSPEALSPPTQPNGIDSKELIQKYSALAFEKGTQQFDWTMKQLSSGNLVELEIILNPVEIDGKTVLQSTARDISERKRMEAEVEKLAYEDDLTHLTNRRNLLNRLAHVLSTYKRTHYKGALLFIDLDHFKVINDTMGHNVGDLLLKEVAKRLLASVRDDDTVARFGGDEFVIMLEALHLDDSQAAIKAEVACEKILSALNTTYQVGDRDIPITASIGVTMFDEHSVDKDLLQQSDIAMYQAKESGRNAIRFFDPKMQLEVDNRAAIEQMIKDALSNNLFELHYQLQVDAQENPLGVEALIRLNHPEKGFVSPMEYIPVAEETGLIIHIGKWVLETACVQLQKWQRHESTANLTIAVNVSSMEFKETSFVSNVLDAIRNNECDPTRLKLELTEPC
ncbi:MAG: diguanylate cyclase [Cycloclasticus sp.]